MPGLSGRQGATDVNHDANRHAPLVSQHATEEPPLAAWCADFLPGDSALDRIAAVTDPALHKPDTMAALASDLERACPGGVPSAHASDQRAAEGLAAGW
jgi:hypothetical protein